MITAIDCHYLFPEFASSCLWIRNNKAILVDCNTQHAIPYILEALQKYKIAPQNVEYIIVTHVHLDHAGGTSALLKHCPKAQILCHPRTARHLIDPTKIIAGATTVYGEERFHKLYGTIEPIDPQRIREMNDEEILPFQNTEMRFLQTRGHAKHHICVWLPESRQLFSGDSFGVSYPEINKNGFFIIPSTSPTDFEPEEAIKTIHRILALHPVEIWPTHFGPIIKIKEASELLLEAIEFSKKLRDETGIDQTSAEKKLSDFVEKILIRRNHKAVAAALKYLWLDIEINAQGIVYAAKKQQAPQN